MKKLFLLPLLTIVFSALQAQETGTLTDSVDGKTYKTVKIGTQWVMAENFAYKPAKGNYWVPGEDTNNISKYGYFYDWQTAKIISPPGWHLPSKKEWETLYNYLGANKLKVFKQLIPGGKSGFNALYSGYRSGGETLWMGSSTFYWSSTDDDGTNAWSFSVVGTDGWMAQLNNYCPYSDGLCVRLFKDVK